MTARRREVIDESYQERIWPEAALGPEGRDVAPCGGRGNGRVQRRHAGVGEGFRDHHPGWQTPGERPCAVQPGGRPIFVDATDSAGRYDLQYLGTVRGAKVGKHKVLIRTEVFSMRADK